jgi:hypothetical protein
MPRVSMRRDGARCGRAVAAALLAGLATAAGALEPGTVLDATTAGEASALLPPETAAQYTAGQLRNRVVDWPAALPWEPAFAAASERNAARLDVDARGTIVERAGGAPATGVYGLPFAIDPADPQAGVKAIWNAYYALWRGVSARDVVTLDWIGPNGLERRAVLDNRTLYHEGVPPDRAPRENRNDLAAQQLAIVTSPADLHGTASLVWRTRRGDRPDLAWTYVPALRRVRQVSPANRSDGFLGSDLSQDDGTFFDGKPEDFTWRLVGARDALVLVDPASLDGTARRRVRPDGTIEETWPAGTPVVGHEDPAWRGLPWAPVAPVLARRPVWVVEAVPRDRYYLFARIELALDRASFQGVTSRKFDASGTLLRSLRFLAYGSQPVEVRGETLRLPAASMAYIAAENGRAGRATVVGGAVPGGAVHERRLPLDPALFTLDRLLAGK